MAMQLVKIRGTQTTAATTKHYHQQQGGIISLVHGCARDHSAGESHLEQLKKRSNELSAEVEIARTALQKKKEKKIIAEEELKCLSVEVAAAEATIQARQTRIESLQQEIARTGSDLEDIKIEELEQRENFTNAMLELNAKLRRMYEEYTLHS